MILTKDLAEKAKALIGFGRDIESAKNPVHGVCWALWEVSDHKINLYSHRFGDDFFGVPPKLEGKYWWRRYLRLWAEGVLKAEQELTHAKHSAELFREQSNRRLDKISELEQTISRQLTEILDKAARIEDLKSELTLLNTANKP